MPPQKLIDLKACESLTMTMDLAKTLKKCKTANIVIDGKKKRGQKLVRVWLSREKTFHTAFKVNEFTFSPDQRYKDPAVKWAQQIHWAIVQSSLYKFDADVIKTKTTGCPLTAKKLRALVVDATNECLATG